MYFVLALEIPYREKPILASMYRLEENGPWYWQKIYYWKCQLYYSTKIDVVM